MHIHRYLIFLMLALAITMTGCDNEESVQSNFTQVSPDLKENELCQFEKNYKEIYASINENVDLVNNGYVNVKINQEYLVDYHDKLTQAKDVLLAKKQDLSNLTVPDSISQTSINNMIHGIDILCEGIDYFQKTKKSADINNITIFEKYSANGSSLIATCNDAILSALEQAKKNNIIQASSDIDKLLKKPQTIPNEQLPQIALNITHNQDKISVTYKNNGDAALVNCEIRIYAFDNSGNTIPYNSKTSYKDGLSVFGKGDNIAPLVPGDTYTGTWTINEFKNATDIIVVLSTAKYTTEQIWKRTLENNEGSALTARTK